MDELNLDLTGTQVDIHRSFAESVQSCPRCGVACPRADTTPQRTSRNLDTRGGHDGASGCRRQKCGAKAIRVPWAGKHSRFTLMLEAFAIRVLEAAANVKKAAQLLGPSWDAAHRILEAAVERGLQRRDFQPVPT